MAYKPTSLIQRVSSASPRCLAVLLLAPCLFAFAAKSTASELSDAQSKVLNDLSSCHKAIPVSTDEYFESPCAWKAYLSTLKGVSYQDLLRSLGPPDVCYVADGDWQDPGKEARCTKSGAPGWRFYHLPRDWFGGGAYFLCRLDADNRCASPFWRGTK
jgi:hypothetical protein